MCLAVKWGKATACKDDNEQSDEGCWWLSWPYGLPGWQKRVQPEPGGERSCIAWAAPKKSSTCATRDWTTLGAATCCIIWTSCAFVADCGLLGNSSAVSRWPLQPTSFGRLQECNVFSGCGLPSIWLLLSWRLRNHQMDVLSLRHHVLSMCPSLVVVLTA